MKETAVKMDPMTCHRQEMEHRIGLFETECDTAINYVLHLKEHASSFLENLPQDKAELKERFLSTMKKLNEYIYQITELNLTLNGLEKDMDTEKLCNKNPAPNPTNLVNGRENQAHCLLTNEMAQSHQTSSTQSQGKLNHTDQLSNEDLACASRSTNSVTGANEMSETTGNTGAYPVGSSLPPQPKLTPGSTFQATIMSVDGANLWLIENATKFVKLSEDMTEYYKKHQDMYKGDIPPFNCCAYFDENDTKSYFRALHIRSESSLYADVYLVDTGESVRVPVCLLRRLASRFCEEPALARCCHLPGVDLPEDNVTQEKQTQFLSKYLWQQFTVELETEVDEDVMDSIGVYIYLDDGTTLNDRLIQEMFLDTTQDLFGAFGQPNDAVSTQNIENVIEKQFEFHQPLDSQNNVDLDEELDITNNPEYENPVEAVTGYNNRDEMDICKHYKGGEGCFKGTRCKKRHVMIHPDGWTLDSKGVPCKVRAATLPAPDTWHKVKVTHVVNHTRFYVHFEQGDEPMTLADLVEEMTRAGANARCLEYEPALGELVSARFTDGRWYRARVTGYTDRGTIEVTYIDFGNDGEVSDAELASLWERWLVLPSQAVLCRLAGVNHFNKEHFAEIVLDKIMKAHIISRGYDELTVELLDLEDFSVAEQLSLISGTTLDPYRVENDSRRLFLHVPA